MRKVGYIVLVVNLVPWLFSELIKQGFLLIFFSLDKTSLIFQFKKYLLSTYYVEITLVDAVGKQIYGSCIQGIQYSKKLAF